MLQSVYVRYPIKSSIFVITAKKELKQNKLQLNYFRKVRIIKMKKEGKLDIILKKNYQN